MADSRPMEERENPLTPESGRKTAVKERARDNQVDGVLQNYLDQLLVVATETRPKSTTDVLTETVSETITTDTPEIETLKIQAATATKPTQPATPTITMPATEVDVASTVTAPAVASTIEPTVEVAAESTVTPAITPSMAPPVAPPANPALSWDSPQGVECLLFKVAGLKLAIPLSRLGGVHPAVDKVTPLIRQAPWTLGVWKAEQGSITVVDSAQLIMPERGVSLAEQGYQYLIQLGQAPWALACQDVCDTITLVSESIKWRGDTSRRPWLAGTVISEMCALLDVPALISLLEDKKMAS
ncbi:MAG: chemotaxis protein CheW [Pseudomonadota bacterium]|nr:chemotaxis protein CheW [Pseudomonadota bacterium]